MWEYPKIIPPGLTFVQSNKEVTVDPIRLVTLLWCCRKTRLDDDRCREVVDLLVQLGAETTDVYPSAKIYQPAVVTSEAGS